MGSCKLRDEGEILAIKSRNDFIKLPNFSNLRGYFFGMIADFNTS